jgi:hypothetical protein
MRSAQDRGTMVDTHDLLFYWLKDILTDFDDIHIHKHYYSILIYKRPEKGELPSVIFRPEFHTETEWEIALYRKNPNYWVAAPHNDTIGSLLFNLKDPNALNKVGVFVKKHLRSMQHG